MNLSGSHRFKYDLLMSIKKGMIYTVEHPFLISYLVYFTSVKYNYGSFNMEPITHLKY